MGVDEEDKVILALHFGYARLWISHYLVVTKDKGGKTFFFQRSIAWRQLMVLV
jgi:hypothetical protein